MNASRAKHLERATTAWQEWCGALAEVGTAALANTITDDEIDFAEGLRHLTRMARLTLAGGMENNDALHPYFERSLGMTLKMGGDNPAGLYLSAPINGTDTYRITGTRGSATWISFMAQRDHRCFAAGLGVFGDAIFTELEVDDDGSFEMILSPEQRARQLDSDRPTSPPRLMVRQFFGDWSDVRPMDLTIENVTVAAPRRPS